MPEHHATLIKEWAAESWINRCPAIIVFLNAFRNVWIRVEALWWNGEPRGILIPFEGTRYEIRVSKIIHFYNGPNNINSSVFFFFFKSATRWYYTHSQTYIYRHRHWQSCHRRENSLLPKAWRIWQTRPNDERLAQNRTPSICMHTPAEFCQLSKQVSQGGSINVGNAWEVQLGVVIDNKQNNRDCVGVARTTTREGLKTTGQGRSAALYTGAQCFVVLQTNRQTRSVSNVTVLLPASFSPNSPQCVMLNVTRHSLSSAALGKIRR